MKSKKETSLRKKLLKFLIVFSLAILGFLWFFQVIFLNTYYEWTKTKEIEKIANKIAKSYNQNKLDEVLDTLSYNEGVCIEIIDKNNNIYTTNSFNRGCFKALPNDNSYINYRTELINNNLNKKIYTLNNNHGSKMIIYVLKLNDDNYLIVNASLLPLNSTINILSRQLVYVTIITFILSFILAYFIAKKISTPIVKLNKQAKDMAKGNHDVVFDAKTDLIEINSLSDTLNQSNTELAKTDLLRRELLANVSHDLKTPLTMIKAYAEMVRDLTYNNKEKRDDNLNTIIDETNRLNLLVNDILELSKIQSKVENLNLEKFDINELIKTVIDRFRYLEETKKYIFKYKELKEAYVFADKRKIEQVIYNLIGNAINYIGNDKTIIVNLSKKDNKYLIEVIDHGKGIDKNEINNIWNKYYRIDKQHKRADIGTGLGLSIVKNIFELHNIEYGVHSKKDKGTTFYFIINKFDSIK